MRRSIFLLVSFAFTLRFFTPSAQSAPEKQAAAKPAEPVVSSANTPDGLAFFEKNIRPVLADKCYKCHSAEAKEKGKLKGALFVDTHEGMLYGGDTGAAIVPGKPKESLLMKAIRHEADEEEMKMPPKEKLPDDVLENFAQWIEMGAPDPRTGGKPVTAKRVINVAEGRQWWAFRPLQNVAVPAAKNPAARTAVDGFIFAKQEAADVKPSAPASREKLIRRAYFDLIGLPPSPEEVDAFVKAAAPNAFEQVVDKLLASERYGERWARHWLDVARFAESNGYEFDAFRPGAFHYRDWVIRAFNADLPYNEFVRMQIAADKLKPNDVEAAAATGFLVAGPYPGQITVKTAEKIRYDQLDDMISTIGGSMLGLTTGCVRCHDHKYDPLAQKDYYAMAAALARTVHGELKIDKHFAETQRQQAALDQAVKAPREALKKFEASEFPVRFEKWLQKEMPRPAPTTPWQIFDVASAEAKTALLETGKDGLVLYAGKKAKDDVYTIKVQTYQQGIRAFRLDAFADKSLPGGGPGLSDNGNFVLGDFKVIARSLAKPKAKPVTLKLIAAKASFEQERYPFSSAVDNSPTSGWGVAPQMGQDHAAIFEIEGAPAGFDGGTELEFQLTFSNHFGFGKMRLAFANLEAVPDLADAASLQNPREIESLLLSNGDAPIDSIRAPLLRFYRRFDERAVKLLADLTAVERLKKPQPDLVTVYSTKAGGQDVFLLRRGEVDNKEAKMGPGFIQVLNTAPDEKRWLPQPETEPRIALANWLTDSEKGAGSLLARVMVNRLWKQHFGRGIVATPNDFGTKGEPPTHPELLEFLAGELVRNGWHLKPLHKLIMLSATYQEGSDANLENSKRDTENKLWWQRPARRLEAEAIRDSLLVMGNRLDTTMYGEATAPPPPKMKGAGQLTDRPMEIEDETPRRSIYLRVRRSELNAFLTLFDAPEPSQSIGDRGATTVATQALTMMNSQFVRDTANRLAKRALVSSGTTEQAIEKAYRIALARPPTPRERERMTAFYAQQEKMFSSGAPEVTPQAKELALTETCLVVLCLNEFVYVD